MRKIVLVMLLLLPVRAALASGDGLSIPWSIDPYGGSPAEQDAFYGGNPGILMGRAPWARLFAAWRMLHGLAVGVAAGRTLALPCCGGGWTSADEAKQTWVEARSAVGGVTPLKPYEIDVFRSVGDFVSVPTCFSDAFTTAARALRERIAVHGTDDPWVRAWVDGQDAVFAACSGDAGLPALAGDAPDWLRADHAYQAAAVALYTRDFGDAEQRFDAIAADPASPWRGLAPYLAARAAVDAALPRGEAAGYAHARGRLAALAPADAYGHGDLAALSGALAFRERPDARRRDLASMLAGPALGANVAADFKDSRRLGQSPAGEPGFLDWIAVFGRAPDQPEAVWFDHYLADQVWTSDAEALGHALMRWKATGDPAWLIAAMAWSAPGEAAADLVAASRLIPGDHPAFLTALYHRVRLAGTGDEAATRGELDAALARPDLSLTTHNLLRAERVMVARDLADLGRLAPRESPCVDADGGEKGCVADDYMMEFVAASTLRPDVRFGDEAAAILDRLPLQDRSGLAEGDVLPAPLRLDLGLTTWVRAVLMQDFVTADRLAGLLRGLLPQMEAEWAAFLAARPGEDKRFAAWFILAKLPGADVDLRGGYVRPQGAVGAFEGHWHDWQYGPASARPVQPGAVTGDVVCFGMCGPGAFPFHVPGFAAAAADGVAKERGRFLPADPEAAGSVWEDVLAYAKAHPRDPRSAEALYWLVRVSRFGTGHNRSSFRAWVLLHKRYPASSWAVASKYFYD